MAYQQPISRHHKALLVFLLNQSRSMENPIAKRPTRKIDELTAEMNAWLAHLVISCSKSDGIRDFFDVAILGYSTDEQANPIISSAMIGPLAGRDIVTTSEICDHPVRIDTVTASIPDEDTGEMVAVPQQTPIWIDPVTRGWAPTCSAIVKACELLDAWIAERPDSFPPIVIHLTDGESSDGDPTPYANALKQRATSDGNVLFLNCCLSSVAAGSCLFKGSDEDLSDEHAKRLFAMSSVLPDSWLDALGYFGECDSLEPNARGFACNTSMLRAIMAALSWARGPSIRR